MVLPQMTRTSAQESARIAPMLSVMMMTPCVTQVMYASTGRAVTLLGLGTAL